MRREFLGVWQYLWPEVWEPLSEHEDRPGQLFMELSRLLYSALSVKDRVGKYDEATSDYVKAYFFFEELKADAIQSEGKFLRFLEQVDEAFESLDCTSLSPVYHELIKSFVARHYLRYSVDEPFRLVPTLEGIFDALVSQLRYLSSNDPSVCPSFREFEQAIGELRDRKTPNQIKRSIHTGINLMEALGGVSPDASANTLGRISDQITCWPHDAVRDALKAIYKFSCDYSGLRHAGTAGNSLREIELRDTVAMAIILAGFTPYLTNRLNHEEIIGGV